MKYYHGKIYHLCLKSQQYFFHTFDLNRKFPLPTALCASLVSLRQQVRPSPEAPASVGRPGSRRPDYVQHVFQCLVGKQVQGHIWQEAEGWGGGSEDSDPSLGEMGPPTSRKCQQSILHMPTAGDGSRDLGVEGQPGVGWGWLEAEMDDRA